LIDGAGKETLHFVRDFDCNPFGMCCMPCGVAVRKHKMTISSPNDTVLGYVWQVPEFGTPKVKILDEHDNKILYIVGPTLQSWSVSMTKEFALISGSGERIGFITKEYGGMAKELFTSADNFNIKCPVDLDVKVKACLIGASIFIDYLWFTGTGQTARLNS